MITVSENNFLLSTDHTAYAFGVNADGMLEHLHYGGPIGDPGDGKEAFRAMHEKVSHGKGTTVNYTKESLTVTEDILLEVSSLGKGDFREPSVIIEYADGSRTSDFIFESFEVMDKPFFSQIMPNAIGDGGEEPEQLKVTLSERNKKVFLDLYYTVSDGIWHDL